MNWFSDVYTCILFEAFLIADPYKSPARSKFCTDLGSYQTSTPKVGHLATSPPTSPKYTRMTFDVREKQSSLDSSPAIVSLLQEKLDDQKKASDMKKVCM